MNYELGYHLLRPKIQILALQNKDIKKYHEFGEEQYRKIFSGPYSKEEEDCIMAIAYQLKLIGFSVPEWWTSADTLRCIQANLYEIEPTLEYIKRSITFFNLNYSLELSKDARELVNKHQSYISGVSPNFEPVIIIDIDNLVKSMNEFSELLTFFMFLTREKMHLRGFVEGNLIIFNLKNKNTMKGGQLVKLALDILQRSFYGFTNKIYFFNVCKEMESLIGSIVNTSMHFVTKQLIKIVSPSTIDSIVAEIGEQNLSRDLAGTYLKVKGKYPWPMGNCELFCQKVTMDIMKEKNIQPFYFCEEIFNSEWKAEDDEDDIGTVFSETNILVKRLQATRVRLRSTAELSSYIPSTKESKPKPKKTFFARLITLDCCGLGA